MKTLADGTQVNSRSYYYLLDWNESNEWRFIADNFGKEKLKDLTIKEYRFLWYSATKIDFDLGFIFN